MGGAGARRRIVDVMPMTHMARDPRALAGIVLLAASACYRQTLPRGALADSSVPQIMAAARVRFDPDLVVDILRQRRRAYPDAKRRELADSVIALAARTRDAISIVGALGAAGYPGSGTPDTCAPGWLITVYRGASDALTRSAALREMSRQVSPERAAPLFFELATSRDGSAFGGIRELIVLVRAPGLLSSGAREEILTGLRRLWDQRLVTDPMGGILMRDLAAEQRWPPPTPQQPHR